MSDRPIEHDCGYVQADVPPGEIMWDTSTHGHCRTCGVQIEYTPTIADLLGTAD
jgi:hypothetical protein